MHDSRRRALRVAAAVALLALGPVGLGGCVDAPTSPALATWLAENSDVAAVLPPGTMPAAAEWLDPGGAVSARVAALAELSEGALGRGRVGAAARMRAEAGAVAAESLAGMPDARLVRRSRQAVDLWLQAVRPGAGNPSIAARALVDSVASHRDSATAALAAGDTLAAGRMLVRTAERIRGAAPRLALLRVIDRADAQVGALPPESREAARARHLVRTARLALDGDDALRALRRAIYATQLARGQRLEEIPREE